MNAPRSRLIALFAYVSAAGAGFACTAILAPNDDVQRCGTADECDATGDPRYVAECRFDPDNNDLDTRDVDKICVAAFKVVSCDPNDYDGPGGDHPFRVAFDTYATATHYTPCDMAADPVPDGCNIIDQAIQCAPGHERNELGFCDEPGNDMPAYDLLKLNGQEETTVDLTGQDVLDAFCQSFFCEDEWVCDQKNGSVCRRCDPDLAPGEGGCGTVYIAGAPSCIYPTADQLSCGDGNTDLDEPRFGACATP